VVSAERGAKRGGNVLVTKDGARGVGDASIDYGGATGIRIEEREYLRRELDVSSACAIQICATIRVGECGRLVEEKLNAFPARAIDGCSRG
jgi:hypothetical protein